MNAEQIWAEIEILIEIANLGSPQAKKLVRELASKGVISEPICSLLPWWNEVQS